MPLGIIGGSSFLQSEAIKSFSLIEIDTDYGRVKLRKNSGGTVYFVQRHGADPEVEYRPPHLINKKAIISALKTLGCERVLGFGSCGGLKTEIGPGTLVVPDDYSNPFNIMSFFEDKRGHIVPTFDADFRALVLGLLAAHTPLDKATYVQTRGPRFETKSEIQMFAATADIVGMTCAHEATLCKEQGIAYCVVCMVDNMANGVTAKELTFEEFHKGLKKNQEKMDNILSLLVEGLSGSAEEEKSESGPIVQMGLLKADTVVRARYIVPVETPGVLENHSLVITDGKIVDMLPFAEADAKYTCDNRVNLEEDHVLMPGFVNSHTHAGMTLLRGYKDDCALMEWLTTAIWPAESEFVSRDFTRESAELAVAEMIKGGTTCFNDMYFHPEATAEVVDQAGLRATLGVIAIDFPSNFAKDFDDYIEKGLAVKAHYANHSRIRFSFAPHAPYTVEDKHLSKMMDMATESKVPFHIHLHETKAEVVASKEGDANSMSKHRSEHKMCPLDNLHRMKMVNENLVAVHMTQLENENIELLAKQGSHVAHCPSSNMKLASGFCRVADLTKAGVNVCIGTDSSASNNKLDMFTEMRNAALLAKAVSSDPTAVPAAEALRMATLNGAKALGLGEVTGSLAVGKSADFLAVKLGNDLMMTPMYDVVSHLVYVAGRENVSDVWVCGKQLLGSKKLLTMDESAVLKRAKAWVSKIQDFRLKQAAAAAEGKK